jgi:hypothetical protein
MASRYWVRNAVGNWNSTANWSSSSAATPGGASVPTTGDVAIFSANSLAGNCTVNISPTVQSVNMTGYAGTLTFNSAGNYITITTTGTVFTGSTSATIVRSGASINGTNIRTQGTTGVTKTISTGAVSEANALNFDISGAGTYTLDGSTGNYGSLAINATTSFDNITVYGNFIPNSSNQAGSSQLTMACTLSVAATAMVAGTTYTITSAGTTNFTSYGAAANTPNTIFVATGAGTGTGTVTPTRLITYNGSNPIVYRITLGNGTSQGSVALSQNTIFSTNSTFVQSSGFFNNNGFSLTFINSSFGVINSNIKNIKITRSSGAYDINCSNSTNCNITGTNTTYDLSTAIIQFDASTGGNVSFAQNLVIGTFKLIYSGTLRIALFINGTNYTFLKLDISQFYSDVVTPSVITPFMRFYYNDGTSSFNPTVNIWQVVNNPVPVPAIMNRALEGTVDGCTGIPYPVTFKKLGGGCDYFYSTRLYQVDGSPAKTWYANTTFPGALTGNALFNAQNFGSNTDNGSNTNINFTQYPALGGFNEFF